MADHVFDTDEIDGLEINRWVPILNRVRDHVGKPITDYLSKTYGLNIRTVIYAPLPSVQGVDLYVVPNPEVSPEQALYIYPRYKRYYLKYTVSIFTLDVIVNQAAYVRHIADMLYDSIQKWLQENNNG